MKKTVKLAVKILIILLIGCFFIPMLNVEGTGASFSVSPAHMVIGYSDFSGKLAAPVLIVAALAVIPAIMLIIGGFKSEFSNMEAFINIPLAVIELAGYVLFRSGVKGYARPDGCDVSASVIWYVAMILCVVVIAGYLVLMLAFKGEVQLAFQDIGRGYDYILPDSPNPQEAAGGWTCSCGNVLRSTDLFCGKCGNRKPE